ncbi:hypothetical protein TI04_00545 [Achromatium sp. WMS2]|nr:hypothetical protein TI04_00545 [Achromatium sp. WMS2]
MRHLLMAILYLAIATSTVNSQAAGGDSSRASAASMFQTNPTQTDLVQELQRLRNEGIAKYESGLALDNALTAFKRAFELSGQAPDAFNVATVYFKKNDVANTKHWLQVALSKDANFPNALYLLGVLARSSGDFATAKRNWERVHQLAPGDAHLNYQLALLARSERNEAGFLQYLINALALDPNNAAALYQMYRYYQLSGNRELAKETLAKFNAIKKQERFSRRERLKDPSRLSQPILFPATNTSGFTVIPVVPQFTLDTVVPSCKPVAAASYVDITKTPLTESIAVACTDGQLLNTEFGAISKLLPIGKVPANTSNIKVEWFDPTGPKVLAITSDKLLLANDVISKPSEYTTIFASAAAPVTLADLDTDGDIDIALGTNQPPLTNASKQKFLQETAFYQTSQLPKALSQAIAVAVADVQRDGVSDLIILNTQQLDVFVGSTIGFTPALQITEAASATNLAVADLSNDGQLDVALVMPNKINILWNLNVTAKDSKPQVQEIVIPFSTVSQLQVTDYNNDGLLDIIILATDGQAVLLRNQGGREFNQQDLGTWPAPAKNTKLMTGDFDNNGQEDLAYLTQQGSLAIAKNHTEGAGHSLAIFTHGVKAAPSGLLTQIEVRRGSNYAYAQAQGQIQHLGIGKDNYVEILRLEWTNGFIESKLKVDAAVTTYKFDESERISGSCPSLFVWNGNKFEYLTDTFISGPMGVPMDRGMYFPVQDRELILIPGNRVKLRNGSLDIRFTEELHESVILDRARLMVVDHPVGTAVYPHSRLAPAPKPLEPFYLTGDLITATKAVGSNGADVTASLASVDKVYADFFKRSPHSGFAEPHWIQLELPYSVDPKAVDALLATGWFYYFESTSMIAEAQRSGPNLPWPWLEQLVDGTWQDVAPIGVPTGKGKTAVVPLKGMLKSRTLRIRSGISTYWDQIAFSMQSLPIPEPIIAELTEATMRFHGVSTLIAHNPERFDYHDVHYSTLWNPMGGHYTSYGPIELLLSQADGKYAVFGSGDEIAFSFQIPALQPPAHFTRSYLLELVGYVKDGDRYTAHPGRIEPMPYLGLTNYPAPADARLDNAQTASPFRNRPPLNLTLGTISPTP